MVTAPVANAVARARSAADRKARVSRGWDRVSVVGEWARCGWPTVAAFIGLEDKIFHHDASVGIARAGERAHGASGDCLDRRDELGGGRDLEEHAGLADALLLAHVDHLALGRKGRVALDAPQRRGAGWGGG